MFWFELPVHFADDSITGTGASTLAGVTSAGSGTYTPAAITGTGASTLDGVTSAGAGTFTGPSITGTGASTLAGVTSAGGGVVPFAHYDASTLGLSNGATVTTWPDLSGHGLDLAQTGGAALPTYATNSLNGLGGVVFAGAERIARSGDTGPAPRTIIFVAHNPPNDGTIKTMYEPSATLIAKWSNADRWIFGNSSSNFLEFTETGLVSTPRLWTFSLAGTGSFVRMDQTQKVSGNLSTPSADGSIVFASVGNTGTGFIFYEFFIFDGVLTTEQIDYVEDYLYDKWFVSGPITGTGASTLDGVTSAGSGTYTPAAITGTGSSTLAGVASVGSGTFTGAITGTGASTLEGVTSAGVGQYGNVTGTGASTLTGVTSVGTGTYAPTAITGTGATTLDGVASTGVGVYTSAAITGTGTSTLGGVSSTGSGTFTLAAITGTGASTLDGVTSAGVGVLIVPITGTGSSTLQGVTSTGTGIFSSDADVDNVICGIEYPSAVCGVEAPLASCRIGT